MTATTALAATAAPHVTPSPRRARHLVAVPDAGPVDLDTSLRLTRRGRLALAGMALGAVAAGSVWLGGAGAASPATESVTVEPGQTLSAIAVAELPELPVAEAATRIQLANGLSTPHVHAGQTLVIPAP